MFKNTLHALYTTINEKYKVDNAIVLYNNNTFNLVDNIKNFNIRFSGKKNIIIIENTINSFLNYKNINIMLGDSSILYLSNSKYRIQNFNIAGKHSKNSYIYRK